MSITMGSRLLEVGRPDLAPRPTDKAYAVPKSRPADDEYRRHKSDARRPGPAGAAATIRARLMTEIAGMEMALALTESLAGTEDVPGPGVRIARDGEVPRKRFAAGSALEPALAWHG